MEKILGTPSYKARSTRNSTGRRMIPEDPASITTTNTSPNVDIREPQEVANYFVKLMKQSMEVEQETIKCVEMAYNQISFLYNYNHCTMGFVFLDSRDGCCLTSKTWFRYETDIERVGGRL